MRALRPPGSDVSVALHEVRPADLRPLLRSQELDVALTRVSGVDDDTLHSAPLRPSSMVLCMSDALELASAESVSLRQLDGLRLLVASPRGTAYTDLLAGAIEAAGARVETVEARVTGGAVLLTELGPPDLVALMPAGTVTREGIVSVPVSDFAAPLVLLWPAGRPSAAVERLRLAL